MRELGKLSAKVRARPNPERVHESLRIYLKREVSPAEVWLALKAALEGQSEAARVSASKVLLDALHEPEREKERDLSLQVAADEFKRRIGDRCERATASLLAGDRDDSVNGEIANELARLRECERQLLAIPEHIRAEHSAA